MTEKTPTKAKKTNKTVGLSPLKRPKSLTRPNQWVGNPMQELFMKYWTSPDSETFGDSYNSALKAGYKPSTAVKIAAPSTANKWIGEYRKLREFTPKHIEQGIQAIAINPSQAKSPDDTRLKAYELLAKIQGMTNPKANVTNNIVVTPILNGMSVNAKDVKDDKASKDVIDI